MIFGWLHVSSLIVGAILAYSAPILLFAAVYSLCQFIAAIKRRRFRRTVSRIKRRCARRAIDRLIEESSGGLISGLENPRRGVVRPPRSAQ